MRDSFKSGNPPDPAKIDALLAAIRSRLEGAPAWDFVFFEDSTRPGAGAGTLRVMGYCNACEAYHWPEEGHVRWLARQQADCPADG